LIIFLVIFFFYQANHKDKESRAAHSRKFDDIVLNNSFNFNSVIVVSNTSIKNNITMSIVHIHSYLNSIKKTLHHTVGIIFTEAELFAIRCSINQAIQIPDVMNLFLRVGNKNNSCIREIQENSIENSSTN